MPSPPPAANCFPFRDHLQQLIPSENTPTSTWFVIVSDCTGVSFSVDTTSVEAWREREEWRSTESEVSTRRIREGVGAYRAPDRGAGRWEAARECVWDRSAGFRCAVRHNKTFKKRLGLVDTGVDLLQNAENGGVAVLGLLTLLTVQRALAFYGFDLRLASLPLRLEDADAQERRRREVLEDGSQEVDKRLAERILPGTWKELHEVAVLVRARKVGKRAPAAPVVVILLTFGRGQHFRTIEGEEFCNLFLK